MAFIKSVLMKAPHHCLRMPFGLCLATEEFESVRQEKLSDLNGRCRHD